MTVKNMLGYRGTMEQALKERTGMTREEAIEIATELAAENERLRYALKRIALHVDDTAWMWSEDLEYARKHVKIMEDGIIRVLKAALP